MEISTNYSNHAQQTQKNLPMSKTDDDRDFYINRNDLCYSYFFHPDPTVKTHCYELLQILYRTDPINELNTPERSEVLRNEVKQNDRDR